MEGTTAAGFADDLNVWWRVSRLHPNIATSLEVSSVVESWGREWQQTFNPAKCKLLVVSRTLVATPVVSLLGVPLECCSSLHCLGVWIDSKLSWDAHIRQVCQRSLTRLHLIQRGVATTLGVSTPLLSAASLMLRSFPPSSILPLFGALHYMLAPPAWPPSIECYAFVGLESWASIGLSPAMQHGWWLA